jgi:hypothetical protein
VLTVIPLILSFAPIPTYSQRPRTESINLGHGTVNVFVANGDSLVAVTDSMITFNAGGHQPVGIKLYTMDDHTVCAMAGFYSEPGPDEHGRFTALIPDIMRDFIDDEHRRHISHLPIALRATELQEHFEWRLTSHLQAVLASQPRFDISDPNLILELTMAGFDDNGSLKIAEITVRPAQTPKASLLSPSIDRIPLAPPPVVSSQPTLNNSLRRIARAGTLLGRSSTRLESLCSA